MSFPSPKSNALIEPLFYKHPPTTPPTKGVSFVAAHGPLHHFNTARAQAQLCLDVGRRRIRAEEGKRCNFSAKSLGGCLARGAWRVREGVDLDGVDWEGGTQSQTLLIRLALSFRWVLDSSVFGWGVTNLVLLHVPINGSSERLFFFRKIT